MNKTRITKLILNSENLESFTIPMSKVAELQINDVVPSISVDQTGTVQRSQACRRFTLRVSQNFLHRVATEAFHENGECLMLDERLARMPDIVDVDLVDADDHRTAICLPWRDGKYEDTNAAMMTSIDQERGLLCLIVE